MKCYSITFLIFLLTICKRFFQFLLNANFLNGYIYRILGHREQRTSLGSMLRLQEKPMGKRTLSFLPLKLCAWCKHF